MYFLMFVAVCILNSFPGISLQKTALSDLWESCLPVMDQCAQLQQSSWIFLWPDTAYPAFPVVLFNSALVQVLFLAGLLDPTFWVHQVHARFLPRAGKGRIVPVHCQACWLKQGKVRLLVLFCVSEFSTTLRGIYLVRDLSEVVYDQPYILQQYIQRPLTVDGFKFDLRYVGSAASENGNAHTLLEFTFLCYQCIPSLHLCTMRVLLVLRPTS